MPMRWLTDRPRPVPQPGALVVAEGPEDAGEPAGRDALEGDLLRLPVLAFEGALLPRGLVLPRPPRPTAARETQEEHPPVALCRRASPAILAVFSSTSFASTSR